MPTIRLTQAAVDKLKPPAEGRVVYWDRNLPGFGLRLTANGARSWVAKYRVNRRAVLETIGAVAKVPEVGDARDLARASMRKAEAGTNPVVEKRTAAARNQVNTVRAAVERYLAECDRNLKPKTAKEWRRIYEHDVLPKWADRSVAEITKADVLELLNDKASRRERKRQGIKEGAAVQAGKMLTRLRTFFGWCIAQDLIETDPSAGVRRPAKEAQRDRVLTDDEIAAFWTGTAALGAPFGTLFRLMLLTAQRESEVAGMRWSEFNNPDEPKIWTVPGDRAKNGKPHLVHLSGLAVEVLGTVKRIKGQDLLFSGTGKTAVSGFSQAKARLDELMLKALRGDEQEADPAGNGDEDDEAGKVEVAPWVLHDLRRTATTGMARLGIAPHVADKVLNHVAGTIRGVAAIYNRFEYLEERKAALEAWAKFVEGIIRPEPQKALLRQAAARVILEERR